MINDIKGEKNRLSDYQDSMMLQQKPGKTKRPEADENMKQWRLNKLGDETNLKFDLLDGFNETVGGCWFCGIFERDVENS